MRIRLQRRFQVNTTFDSTRFSIYFGSGCGASVWTMFIIAPFYLFPMEIIFRWSSWCSGWMAISGLLCVLGQGLVFALFLFDHNPWSGTRDYIDRLRKQIGVVFFLGVLFWPVSILHWALITPMLFREGWSLLAVDISWATTLMLLSILCNVLNNLYRDWQDRRREKRWQKIREEYEYTEE